MPERQPDTIDCANVIVLAPYLACGNFHPQITLAFVCIRVGAMSKDLIRVLTKSETDLAEALLFRRQLGAGPAPLDAKARGIWAYALLMELRAQADNRLADLTEDTKRVISLSEARFDWLFVRTARPNDGAEWLRFDTMNRSLWFLLNDQETFEKIERRASYELHTSQKNRHTRFCVPAELSARADDETIGIFEKTVQKLYRQHDGSGLHAETDPDDSLTPNGDALHLVTVSLSQLPSSQAEFSEKGELDTRPVQRVTEVQASYEPVTGDLYVTTTRGGYSIRFEIATLFAELVLGLKEAPAVAEANQFDLGAIVATTELPAVPGFEFSELYLAEAEFCHPDRSSTVVSLRDGEGIDAALIEAFCPAGTQLRILSLTYRILCRPAGTHKAKWIRLKLNEDGSTSLKGDVKLDYELREKISELWGLRQLGDV